MEWSTSLQLALPRHGMMLFHSRSANERIHFAIMEAHASIDENRLCDESISVFHAEGSLIDDDYHLCHTIREVAEEKGLCHGFLVAV